MRLQLLNLYRWLRENLIVWGILSAIYSLIATVLLQTILEQTLKQELSLFPVWSMIIVALLVPAVFEALPLPPLPLPLAALSRPLAKLPLVRLYVLHDLRKGSTWLLLAAALAAGALLPDRSQHLWILVVQLPLQRALYSVHRWRRLALGSRAHGGASQIVQGLFVSQAVQATILVVGFALLRGAPSFGYLALWIASLSAVIGGASMAMEGDSGKPWMVNFISLSVGTLGGYICLAQPGLALVVFYFAFSMSAAVAKRLWSVENFDEDTFIP